MSYRNHYMCNGEATCILQPNIHKAQILYWYKKQKSQHFAFTGKKLSESPHKKNFYKKLNYWVENGNFTQLLS